MNPSICQLLKERILVLDGAMGTAIQAAKPTAEDFGGPEFEGCNEQLVLTRPDLISAIHESYLKAGADILETNTFGATPLVLSEFNLAQHATEINRAAAHLARALADRYSTPEKPRFVAGSIGPTTKAISVTGGITFQELVHHFYVQAHALLDGGVDYLLFETCQDTRTIKAGLIAVDRLAATLGREIPVAVSVTIEPTGTMLAGQDVEALVPSLEHRPLLYLGLNCATGPEFMTDSIRTLSRLATTPIACVPNAGLPDSEGRYLESPAMMASVLSSFCAHRWINLLGGCCGTTPAHIQALVEVAKKFPPRLPPGKPSAYLSGIEALQISADNRPILVGERTNVIGSRKFKRLISNEQFEEATEIARAQVRGGAQVIDVCLSNPDRDELLDMERFMELVIRKVKLPFMIDSTDERVIESALTYCQGKAIINSVNLEHGEERFEKVVPLARRYGAALVVGTIDDDKTQGMAVTRSRKLAIAERSYGLLTGKYGIPPRDLYFDALVFPCGTGDQQYLGSAVETIAGVRAIKERFPECHTVLGISNVSFGLPEAGREVLNSVFLYELTQAGLDLAIVNTEKLVRYALIPEAERALCENLLKSGDSASIQAFVSHFRERKATVESAIESLTAEERLSRAIVEGTKEGLIENLNEALTRQTPLQVINGPLMAGMDQVGKLFNSNQMIVAEVLQSAEVMKAAVNYLRLLMPVDASAHRGSMVLCTVKGDVHDIGKNLVDIILTNNGYRVINLGIKIPPEKLIEAVREHTPDLIGLSGLLVKSALQMVDTVRDLAAAQIQIPVLVGGAALSRQFTMTRILPAYGGGVVAYAPDAMSGLDLANAIVDPERFETLKRALADTGVAPESSTVSGERPVSTVRSREIPVLSQCPEPPDLERHLLDSVPIETVAHYINPMMLYGRHLGFKKASVKKIESGEITRDSEGEDKTAGEAVAIVHEFITRYRDTLLRPRALFQFFRAVSRENSLLLLNPEGEIIERFSFLRQNRPEGLCLSDLTNPEGAAPDSVALFVTTAGTGVRAEAERMKAAGEYLKSHILHALSLELAEGFAEYLHAKIRAAWGFPDSPETTMLDRFRARYRGKRYSFGYPACPNLDDQTKLFRILRPEEIGVTLTDGMMMDPESSVSALVFHHPNATYFAVKRDDRAE